MSPRRGGIRGGLWARLARAAGLSASPRAGEAPWTLDAPAPGRLHDDRYGVRGRPPEAPSAECEASAEKHRPWRETPFSTPGTDGQGTAWPRLLSGAALFTGIAAAAERRPGRGRAPAAGTPAGTSAGSPAGTSPGAQNRAGAPGGRAAAWAQLLRVSALFSVPGDALAGAAAAGRGPNRRTALAVGSSLCLYEAGMALNDYADRDIDAVERPDRPLPSGRISPGEALGASVALTAAGIGLAAAAGRPALAAATALAGAVWAYDMGLKHTPFGPAAMAAARGLDLTLGAVATAGQRPVPAGVLTSAGVLGAHTYAVTAVSRQEATGGSSAAPLAALGAVGAIATGLSMSGICRRDRDRTAQVPDAQVTSSRAATALPAAVYAATAARPLVHAALNPTPPLLQRAVGGGIRATIPLQAALSAHAGRALPGAALLALLPAAARLSRKVSPT